MNAKHFGNLSIAMIKNLLFQWTIGFVGSLTELIRFVFEFDEIGVVHYGFRKRVITLDKHLFHGQRTQRFV